MQWKSEKMFAVEGTADERLFMYGATWSTGTISCQPEGE